MSKLYCKECGLPIGGGKGDYWHTDSGDMQGPDGHLAYPTQTQEVEAPVNENDTFDELTAALAEDPAIKAAASDHNDACEDDEATCVVCNTKKALSQLMYVSQALEHSNHCNHEDEDCGELSELEIADSMVDDLESALYVISACQTGIRLLAGVSQAAAFIIHSNELDDDFDEDDEE